MKKRLLNFFVLLTIVTSLFTVIPITVNADTSGKCGDNLTWTLKDGTLIISGTGEMNDYGHTDAGYIVAPWYDYEKMSEIHHIIIEHGVTSIGNDAFLGCHSVINISIPNTVTSVGHFAFKGCSSLKNISIPESVTEIGSYAFDSCASLENITIPENVSILGDGIFDLCWDLKEITFLGDVPSMMVPNNAQYEYGTFWGITATAYYPANNSTWTSDVINEYYGGNITWVAQSDSKSNTEKYIYERGNLIDNLPKYPDDGQMCWVVFREGYRDNRVELSTCDVDADINDAYIVWDSDLTLYGSNADGEYNQYYLYEETEWIKIGTYDKFSDYATEVISSNLDIYDNNGNLIKKGTNYRDYPPIGVAQLDGKNDTKNYTISMINNLSINVGEEGVIRATLKEDGETVFEDLTWESSNEDIAQVVDYSEDITGMVAYIKGVSSGTTTITARYGDVKATCNVIVNGQVKGINIYTNEPLKTVTIGNDFLIGVSIIDDNEKYMDLSGISFSVEDKNILSTGKTMQDDGILYCSFTATGVGTTQIKISDYNSNQTATIRFTVNEVTGNAYTIYNIPEIYCDKTACNFANFNGLYIDSYKKNLKSDGSCDISFNVYNTLYIHGAVEVYNADGKLIRAFDIDKMDYEESLKDTWDSAVGFMKSLFSGKLLKYQSTTFSKLTPINIENIPKGGYIRISTDPRESYVCGIINSFDILSQLKGYVSNITANEDALSETTIKIIENSANDFSKKWQENFSKEIIGKSINSEDAASNFADELLKMFSGEEWKQIFTEAMVSSGVEATADGVEKWFIRGTAFIGATLKGMFTANEVMSTILQANQFNKAINRGSIFIQIPAEDKRTCSNVTVECELDEDVALDVYTFDEEKANEYLKNIEDYYRKHNPQPDETHTAHPIIPSDIDIVSAYDIKLIQNGNLYVPDGDVRLTIKLPKKLEGKVGEITIYRIEKNGTATPIKGVSDGKYVTFITNHFSVYLLTSDTGSNKISHVSNWAKAEVEEAYNKGLVPESLMNIDLTQTISRAEFADLAITLYEKMSGNSTQIGENPFYDIDGHPLKNEILKAYDAGITQGTSDSTFNPYDNISREQLSTMLTRVIKKVKFDTWNISEDSLYVLDTDGVSYFYDDEYIADYAYESVYFMSKYDIVKGVDNYNFSPKSNATREQGILIALRCFKILLNKESDTL